MSSIYDHPAKIDELENFFNALVWKYLTCLPGDGRFEEFIQLHPPLLMFPFESALMLLHASRARCEPVSQSSYWQSLFKLRDVDKELLAVTSQDPAFTEMPQFMVQDIIAFSPLQNPPISAAEEEDDARFRMFLKDSCAESQVVLIVLLIKSRINDMIRIVHWHRHFRTWKKNLAKAKKQQYVEMRKKAKLKIFPLGDSPTSTLTIIVHSTRGFILLNLECGHHAEMTFEEAGLTDTRYTLPTPSVACNTLANLAIAAGGPLKLDHNHVKPLNAALRRILALDYDTVLSVGRGNYKTEFHCQAVN